jgi:hypothetical protein
MNDALRTAKALTRVGDHLRSAGQKITKSADERRESHPPDDPGTASMRAAGLVLSVLADAAAIAADEFSTPSSTS